ncbi:MAG: hypothetical protein QXP80_05920 [Zestosphaera sp.]
MAGQSTSIYTRVGLDEVLATAILSNVLTSKGVRVFIEFVPQTVRNPVKIIKSYAVGLTPSQTVSLTNTIGFQVVPEKRLGIVTKYDESGKGEVLMSLSETSTLTQTVLEYVETLNTVAEIPDQLLKDVISYATGRVSEMSKVGKALVKAVKMNYNSTDFSNTLYIYFTNVIRTKLYKLNAEIEREAAKHDEALKLIDELLKSDNLIPYGPLRVAVISRSFDKQVIKDNYWLLKPLTYDLLTRLCREDGVGMVVLETELGHTLRICLGVKNVSFVNIISSLPKELSSELNVMLKGNHVMIKFKDPSRSSLDTILNVVDVIASNIAPLLISASKT